MLHILASSDPEEPVGACGDLVSVNNAGLEVSVGENKIKCKLFSPSKPLSC